MLKYTATISNIVENKRIFHGKQSILGRTTYYTHSISDLINFLIILFARGDMHHVGEFPGYGHNNSFHSQQSFYQSPHFYISNVFKPQKL